VRLSNECAFAATCDQAPVLLSTCTATFEHRALEAVRSVTEALPLDVSRLVSDPFTKYVAPARSFRKDRSVLDVLSDFGTASRLFLFLGGYSRFSSPLGTQIYTLLWLAAMSGCGVSCWMNCLYYQQIPFTNLPSDVSAARRYGFNPRKMMCDSELARVATCSSELARVTTCARATRHTDTHCVRPHCGGACVALLAQWHELGGLG
jgi:hypothetical protein